MTCGWPTKSVSRRGRSERAPDIGDRIDGLQIGEDFPVVRLEKPVSITSLAVADLHVLPDGQRGPAEQLGIGRERRADLEDAADARAREAVGGHQALREDQRAGRLQRVRLALHPGAEQIRRRPCQQDENEPDAGSDLKSIQRKDFPGVRMDDLEALLERCRAAR